MTFYGTLAGADQYHAARGNDAWFGYLVPEKEGALTRASDYIDRRYRKKAPTGRWQSLFVGTRAGGRAQLREWPRAGAEDYEGAPIGPAEIPPEVQHATYEAALREAESPGGLSPDFVPAELVTREKVDVIETSFAVAAGGIADGTNPMRPVVDVVDEILAPLLRPTCGASGIFAV